MLCPFSVYWDYSPFEVALGSWFASLAEGRGSLSWASSAFRVMASLCLSYADCLARAVYLSPDASYCVVSADFLRRASDRFATSPLLRGLVGAKVPASYCP